MKISNDLKLSLKKHDVDISEDAVLYGAAITCLLAACWAAEHVSVSDCRQPMRTWRPKPSRALQRLQHMQASTISHASAFGIVQ